MSDTAVAYGYDLKLKTEEYGQVSLRDAIGLFDRRLSNMRDYYESGEEALRDTMVGFSRGDDNFIQLCIHGRNHVACTIELPSLEPGGIERTLTDRAEVVAMLTDFFTLPETAFAERLEPAS
jgi:hypothetical protein